MEPALGRGKSLAKGKIGREKRKADDAREGAASVSAGASLYFLRRCDKPRRPGAVHRGGAGRAARYLCRKRPSHDLGSSRGHETNSCPHDRASPPRRNIGKGWRSIQKTPIRMANRRRDPSRVRSSDAGERFGPDGNLARGPRSNARGDRERRRRIETTAIRRLSCGFSQINSQPGNIRASMGGEISARVRAKACHACCGAHGASDDGPHRVEEGNRDGAFVGRS